ncbi:MAG: hypothetical protein ABL860_07440 [Candidatus Nitrotoga sp.]
MTTDQSNPSPAPDESDPDWSVLKTGLSDIAENERKREAFVHALQIALYNLPSDSKFLEFMKQLAIAKGESISFIRTQDSSSKARVALHAADFFQHMQDFLREMPETERKELKETGKLSAQQLIKFQASFTDQERIALQHMMGTLPDRRSALKIMGGAIAAATGVGLMANSITVMKERERYGFPLDRDSPYNGNVEVTKLFGGFVATLCGLVVLADTKNDVVRLAKSAMKPEEINALTANLVREADAAFTQALATHQAMESTRKPGGAGR